MLIEGYILSVSTGSHELVVISFASEFRMTKVNLKLHYSVLWRHDSLVFIRYEVKFQNGMDCGGAYIKLLTHNNNLDLVILTKNDFLLNK